MQSAASLKRRNQEGVTIGEGYSRPQDSAINGCDIGSAGQRHCHLKFVAQNIDDLVHPFSAIDCETVRIRTTPPPNCAFGRTLSRLCLQFMVGRPKMEVTAANASVEKTPGGGKA